MTDEVEDKRQKIEKLRALMSRVSAKTEQTKNSGKKNKFVGNDDSEQYPVDHGAERTSPVENTVMSSLPPAVQLAGRFTAASHLPCPLEQLVPGREVANEDGTVFVTEEVYPANYQQGSERLDRSKDISRETLWLLTGDESMWQFDIDGAVFIDTETTGLARTTATYAFMVGCGWFEADNFIVRQYFMHRLEDDAALVRQLDRDLQGRSTVVSFNGKLFDVPLLRTRFLMNGRSFPLGAAPHLDLLQCTRRLWRQKLRWCNLKHLETELLAVERTDDVPGAEIPDLYSAYRETRNGWFMQNVFTHNRIDIVSLPAILGLIARTVSLNEREPELSAAELFSLGTIYLSRGQKEQAIDHLERARLRGPDAELENKIIRRLAMEYKRANHYDQARDMWETLIAVQQSFDWFPYEEMAKFLEHNDRDFEKAIALCELALDRLEGERHFLPLKALIERKIMHRLARLRMKLAGQTSPDDESE